MGSYASLLLSNADEANSTMSRNAVCNPLSLLRVPKRMTAMIDTCLTIVRLVRDLKSLKSI